MSSTARESATPPLGPGVGRRRRQYVVEIARIQAEVVTTIWICAAVDRRGQTPGRSGSVEGRPSRRKNEPSSAGHIHALSTSTVRGKKSGSGGDSPADGSMIVVTTTAPSARKPADLEAVVHHVCPMVK